MYTAKYPASGHPRACEVIPANTQRLFTKAINGLPPSPLHTPTRRKGLIKTKYDLEEVHLFDPRHLQHRIVDLN